MAYNHREKYLKEWNARGYLTSKYCDASQFVLEYQQEKDFISSFPDNSLKILEYSGGPSILSLINRVPKASEIVFSDFLESNREEVKSWLNNNFGAFNWKPAISQCLTFEGSNGDELDVLRRESMLREKIKAVVHCDLSSENIIEEGYEGPYDLVGCEGVLDDLCATREQFGQAVKKLSTLVKRGGYLILTTDDSDSYSFSGLEFTNLLELSKDDILDAFRAAGFVEVVLKSFLNPGDEDETYITYGIKA